MDRTSIKNIKEELIDEFSRFDKALGLWFLRNSSGPTYFNELNNQIRPHIRIKTLEKMKFIWMQSWNVWKLEEDLLIDVWFQNDEMDGKFHNDDRVKLRIGYMENLNMRLNEFKKRLNSVGDDEFNNLIIKNNKNLQNWFDEHDQWMETSGFNIQRDIKMKRKESIMGIMSDRKDKENVYSISNRNTKGAPATTTVVRNISTSKPIVKPIKRSELKDRNAKMLERIRAKELERKSKMGEILAIKKEKEQQTVRDQFKRVYSIIYEQAPKFATTSVGMSIGRLQKLVEDSATVELESGGFSQVVKEIADRVPGLSLVKVGEIQVLKIKNLDREGDLNFLK